MKRHEFIVNLHKQIRPRTYLETGVHRGDSLTLSRVPSIGIDPEFSVIRELRTDVHLVRASSDEFFAREEPLAHLPVPIIDFAFIDGMHLAEYAMRDFLGVERFTEPTSVILFDDMLPRSVDEAARWRHTGMWTGDVFKTTQALRDLCPELIVIDVDTKTTGTAVVLLPNAARSGILPGYDDWLDVAMTPDPQAVPEQVLRRERAVDPEKLLQSPGWKVLRDLRGRSGQRVNELIREAFSDVYPG